jgi:hypothetical protein
LGIGGSGTVANASPPGTGRTASSRVSYTDQRSISIFPERFVNRPCELRPGGWQQEEKAAARNHTHDVKLGFCPKNWVEHVGFHFGVLLRWFCACALAVFEFALHFKRFYQRPLTVSVQM